MKSKVTQTCQIQKGLHGYPTQAVVIQVQLLQYTLQALESIVIDALNAQTRESQGLDIQPSKGPSLYLLNGGVIPNGQGFILHVRSPGGIKRRNLLQGAAVFTVDEEEKCVFPPAVAGGERGGARPL